MNIYIWALTKKTYFSAILLIIATLFAASCSDEPSMSDDDYLFAKRSMGSTFWGDEVKWNEIVSYKLADGSIKKSLVHYKTLRTDPSEYALESRVCFDIYRNGEKIENVVMTTPLRSIVPCERYDFFDIDLVYTPTGFRIKIYDFIPGPLEQTLKILPIVSLRMDSEGKLIECHQDSEDIVKYSFFSTDITMKFGLSVITSSTNCPKLITSSGIEQGYYIGNLLSRYPRIPIVFDDEPSIESVELLDLHKYIDLGYYSRFYIHPRYDKLIKTIDEGMEWLE